jgi:cytochrome bd-type quinol oxidase subunit 2
MSRPPLLVRVAGSPLPAFLLFVGYAAVVAGWYEGDLTWWLALAAVGASMRTLSAVGRVRRYKAWLAEWNAMNATEQPQVKEKRGGRRRLFVTGAALLLLAIPAGFQHLQGNEQWGTALTLLWIVACVYLLGVVLRSIKRRMAKRRKTEQEAAAVPVVEWMLGRASSSPSRSEAARKLPEYSTRLLGS